MSNNSVVSIEDSFLIVFLGAAALVSIFFFARTFREESIAAMVNRLERTVGLAIPDELRPAIGRNIVRRQRIKLASTVVAAAAMSIVAFTVTFPDANYRGIVVVGSVLAGSLVGVAIGSLQWPAQRHDDGLRVAKAGAVSLRDYVPRWELRGARILVALSATIFFGSVLATATGLATVSDLPMARTSAYFTGIAVLSLIFFEVVGRRIVGRAQPNGSEMELVWDDALRAVDLRALASTPLTIGLLGVFFGASDLALSLPDLQANPGLLTTLTVAGWVVVAGVFAMAFATLTSRPERFFLLRLWPAYAPETFIEPGVVTSQSVAAERRESGS